jgi:hypothetical protein
MANSNFGPFKITRDAAAVQATLDMKEKIKRNNFEYGSRYHQQADHFRTMNQNVYSHKGDANKIMARLNQDTKDAISKENFSYGGPSASIVRTTSGLCYRPSSAQQRKEARPMVDQNLKNELRASHWGEV